MRPLDHRRLVAPLHELEDLARHGAFDDGEQRRDVELERAALGTAEVQRADAELVVGGDGNAVQQASDLRLGKAIGPTSPLALAHPLRDLLGEAFGAHARGAER